jgi:hypothetical protein
MYVLPSGSQGIERKSEAARGEFLGRRGGVISFFFEKGGIVQGLHSFRWDS